MIKPDSHQVIKVHTYLFILTVVLPVSCWLLHLLPVNHCLALAGVGLFVLSGHTIAFFDEYRLYLKGQPSLADADDEVIKKILHFGIGVDLLLAFYFYIVGI